MKVTLIGHACVLIQHGTISMLVDPWLLGRSYENHEIKGSAAIETLDELSRLDLLLFSHPHEDHFHLDSLLYLRKNRKIDSETTVLIPKYKSKKFKNEVADFFSQSNIIEIEDVKTKFFDFEITLFWAKNNFDTAVHVSVSGGESVFLQTDAASFSASSLASMSNFTASVCFLLGGLTGPWPLFFDYPLSLRYSLNVEKQLSIIPIHLEIIKRLSPDVLVLYANDQFPVNGCYYNSRDSSLESSSYHHALRDASRRHVGVDRLPVLVDLEHGGYLNISPGAVHVGGKKKLSQDLRFKYSEVGLPSSSDFRSSHSEFTLTSSEKLAIDVFIEKFVGGLTVLTQDFTLTLVLTSDSLSIMGQIDCSNNAMSRSAAWRQGSEFLCGNRDLTIYMKMRQFKSWVFGIYSMGFDTFNSGIVLFKRVSHYQSSAEYEFLRFIKSLKF